MAKDKYQILGVSSNATIDEIRAAYLRLARIHHPDLNPSNAQAEADFKAIQLAYEALVDRNRRLQFNPGRTQETVVEAGDYRRRRADFSWTQHGGHDPHFDIHAAPRVPRTLLSTVAVAGLCLSILLFAGYAIYWMSESTATTAAVDFSDLPKAERVLAKPNEKVVPQQVTPDQDVIETEEVLEEIQNPPIDFAANVEDSFSVKLEEAASEVVAALSSGELLEAPMSAADDSFVVVGFDQEVSLDGNDKDAHQITPAWSDLQPYGGNELPENVVVNGSAQPIPPLDSLAPPLPAGPYDAAFDTVVAVSTGAHVADSVPAMPVGSAWPESPADFSREGQDLPHPALDRPWELANPWKTATAEHAKTLIPDLSLAEQMRQRRADFPTPVNADGARTHTKTPLPGWPLATAGHGLVTDPTSPSFSSLNVRPNGVQTSVHALTTYRQHPPATPPDASGKYIWDTVTGNLQVAPTTNPLPGYSPQLYRTPSVDVDGHFTSPVPYNAPAIPY